MPLDREITGPKLGSSQEPTALTWKSSLRSPAASPRGPRKSRSRSRSTGLLQSSLRSRTPSPTLNTGLTQSSASNVRKSYSSGKLSTSFNKSAELKGIENDYIKNLQQQVYFLELEANYLREQAKKATEMHPQMTAEAERMLTKLRCLQSEVDDLNVESRRKDTSLELINAEKSKVLTRLVEEERGKERMKRVLQDEIDEIKCERDRITLDNTRLENHIERLNSEKESLVLKLRESQNNLAIVREQLEERTGQHKVTQLNLEEKRAQCLEAETRAQQVETHYLNTTQRAHERQINEYKDELRVLRQQLKEEQRQADDERFIKNKTQDDNDKLSKANALLNRQINDLTSQLIREQELKNEAERSHTEDVVEISVLSDREKELRAELRSAQQELAGEKERCDRYLAQLRRQEEENSNLESTNNSVKLRLVGTEAEVSAVEKENISLRRDKDILTDHVADLQRQLKHKESELANSRTLVRELERDLDMVETEKKVDEGLQSEKWREFESLADGMKKLSRTMARSSTSPRSSVKFS